MTKRTPIIGGNWKMNTDLESGMQLAGDVADGIAACDACEIVIYPPFPFLQAIDSVVDQSQLRIGAQNAWPEENGAFTGEVSGVMLSELGVTSILVGHSERRHVLGETNAMIAKKAASLIDQGFQIVLCVGETLEEREADNTLEVVLHQVGEGLNGIDIASMNQVVIAYEPVWAIGTGKTATPDDAQTVHKAIRACIVQIYDQETAEALRIQYGGSVNPDNAAGLFACEDIDGALVGGASLSADSFTAIVLAACDS